MTRSFGRSTCSLIAVSMAVARDRRDRAGLSPDLSSRRTRKAHRPARRTRCWCSARHIFPACPTTLQAGNARAAAGSSGCVAAGRHRDRGFVRPPVRQSASLFLPLCRDGEELLSGPHAREPGNRAGCARRQCRGRTTAGGAGRRRRRPSNGAIWRLFSWRPENAALHWCSGSGSPPVERRAGDGVNDELVAPLEKLRVRRNETNLISAPLAARLGLERLWSVDDHSADTPDSDRSGQSKGE